MPCSSPADDAGSSYRAREVLTCGSLLEAAGGGQGRSAPAVKTSHARYEEGERHLEVRVGNVETATRRRRVFGAVARNDTDLAALIRGSLDAVGRTKETVLSAFTDGCPGLRRILLDAGITELPILDWFHLAMRLQHLTQVAGSLSPD